MTTKELQRILEMFPYDVPIYLNSFPDGSGEDFESLEAFHSVDLCSFRITFDGESPE